MKLKLLYSSISLLLLSNINFSQKLNLNTLENVFAFTSDGAISNINTAVGSIFTGDIAAGVGFIIGFGLESVANSSLN